MKKALLFALIPAFLFLLSGCLYPQEKRIENQMPVPERVKWVQEAVDAYRKQTGVLPIQTREANTPIYEKYPIDFGKLVPKYLPYIPGDAFEQGGTHLYVLVDPENDPKVRLLDVQTAQIVADVQKATDLYWIKNHRLPATEVRYFPQFFNVEFEKLGMQDILIQSPFTGHYLPLIMDQVGHIGVDYAQDIAMFLEKTDPEKWQDRDLRELLVEQSLFVPVKSFPYRLVDGKPTPQLLSSQQSSQEKSKDGKQGDKQ
ncbi:MAG: hypothetical protein BAA01_02830 [Bacillus thermozeamaize]|uniref:Uncharacterized protein n=1 Tax=Bacillus thermozeamaize TaxID=230954 RepID=A0A1Y3PQR7_9BACI|nr:MAG: hypothetical protein BAA01_02830 [Bacillus thermozeamaize]